MLLLLLLSSKCCGYRVLEQLITVEVVVFVAESHQRSTYRHQSDLEKVVKLLLTDKMGFHLN